MRKKLVLGFGHEAQQGKDHAAKVILRERGGDYKIVLVAFADALRDHIKWSVDDLVRKLGVTRQEAMMAVCFKHGAAYERDAKVDEQYPDGKQRELLQNLGQQMRDIDPDYWVKILNKTIAETDADVIIITDVRQPNEFYLVWELDGVNAKFVRYGFAGLGKHSTHVSEVALKDFPFDAVIGAKDGDHERLEFLSLSLFDGLIKNHSRKSL